MLRQVFQGPQVSAQCDGPGVSGAVRQIQGVVEAQCRAAVSVWSPRGEIGSGANHRGHGSVPRCYCLFDVGRAAWFRGRR